MSRRVFVTGLGAVSACGAGVEAYWAALLAARTGVRPLARYAMDGFPVSVAATVEAPFEDYCPPCPWRPPLEPEASRRNARLLAAAVAEGLRSCGWLDERGRIGRAPEGVPPDRRGLYAAVRPEEDETSMLDTTLATPPPASLFHSMPAFRVAADLGLEGPQLMLHDACTTGTALLGEAFHDLRDGRADLALVAAANADVTLDTLCHYSLLSALSPGRGGSACRPFDARRDGFVRAEGSAALLLMACEDGGPVPDGAVAELAGYGCSADAYRPTAGHPEERGVVLAIERCLDDAGESPDAVEHVNAHGTGTPMNDMHEARALRRVFGERSSSIPLTANKAVTGHASFASGLLEAIAAVRTLAEGRIPPTAHYETVDPELPPLDIVAGAPRESRVSNALSLSSAFGGLNAAVLIRRV